MFENLFYSYLISKLKSPDVIFHKTFRRASTFEETLFRVAITLFSYCAVDYHDKSSNLPTSIFVCSVLQLSMASCLLFCGAPAMRIVSSVSSDANTRTKNGLRAVKICAVTTPSDAEMVLSIASAELPSHVHLLLGMILWPGSRRNVSTTIARQIATVTKDAGATPVGVFVDQDVSTISNVCDEADITIAQLHGPKCRQSWRDASTVPQSWIDVRDVSVDGDVSPATIPATTNKMNTEPLWTVYDAKGGGTGQPFDWNTFTPPTSQSWLLAGGLNSQNISDAVHTLRPFGLDVATGVSGPDKVRKDRNRLREFLQRAIDAYY